ncbi:hypothetical protein E2562_021305 [Oryza meyeriana var. granulata]|uniref:Secreted protein n=1 Tax=Oryza meyeriana var. granulata TaxID=110450 RepID=A0A6G1BYR6_9ORYZ|nr:hypothetical protein E2562_021305 [Oryza meyeriana var. granulata]
MAAVDLLLLVLDLRCALPNPMRRDGEDEERSSVWQHAQIECAIQWRCPCKSGNGIRLSPTIIFMRYP